MLKKRLSFALFSTCVLLIIILSQSGLCETIHEKIIYVDDDGIADYNNIIDAIENASDRGTTIYIHKGIYVENFSIVKDIKIIGLDNPVIHADNNEINVISIYADNVKIQGLVIDNPNNFDNCKAIYVNSDNNVISNCSINNFFRGVYLYNSKNNYILNNMMNNCSLNGVDFIKSDLNIFENNYIYKNAQYGLNLWRSSNNTILKNNFIENVGVGLTLNSISNNNIIFLNDFINNSLHAEDFCKNKWYNKSLIKGNYWDNYMVLYPDASNVDGVWDSAYIISLDGDNLDVYPLVDSFKSIDLKEDVEVKNKVDNEDNNVLFTVLFVFLGLFFVFILIIIKLRKKK